MARDIGHNSAKLPHDAKNVNTTAPVTAVTFKIMWPSFRIMCHPILVKVTF
jgi:hypothetical protein